MRSKSERELEGLFLLKQIILKWVQDKDMKKEIWFRPFGTSAYSMEMPACLVLKTRSSSSLGSHGRRQGGASWPMENYFQAEAFNLDKVLDEFEQNEGEPLR